MDLSSRKSILAEPCFAFSLLQIVYGRTIFIFKQNSFSEKHTDEVSSFFFFLGSTS